MRVLLLAGSLTLAALSTQTAVALPGGATHAMSEAATNAIAAESVTYRYGYRYRYHRPFVYGYYARPRIVIAPRYLGFYRPYYRFRY